MTGGVYPVVGAAPAPYKATLELDIWAWKRVDASRVVEQLLAELEIARTTVTGGTTVHHQIASVTVRSNQ